jgi:GNAT superfamily N-acetyltransferase
MSSGELELSFEEIGEGDIPELTEVMRRAFDDDAQKHLGQEHGGPDGYDDGRFFHQWLFGYEQTVGYKVTHAGKTIGGIIVWILPQGHNVLGTIFVDPAHQDVGVGTRLWQFVEAQYPETKSWRLATPPWATKNHYFYEARCGFKRVESDPILETLEEEVAYRKEIEQQG